jgi:4-hydroxybenzoate polyprenyltransferase
MTSTAPGYWTRMRHYFAEMLPIPAHLLVAALTYLGVGAYGRVVHDLRTSMLSWATLVGIWSVFNLFVMLRLMDEFKDRDIDRALFPERPFPAGRVFESDLRVTLAAAIILYLGLNLTLGASIWAALAVFAYLCLMFRFFFMPATLRGSLLLSLATHTPIVALMLLHGFCIFAVESHLAAGDIRWRLVLPYVAMIWAGYAAWEIAKKTRLPGDETAYVTYSGILGQRGAVLFAASLQVFAVAVALWLWRKLGLSVVYPGLVLSAIAVMLGADVLFLYRPGPRTSRPRPYAEAFILIMLAAQAVEFGWHAAWPG